MLELIAVLVILSLLSTFGVMGVRSIISRAARTDALVRIEAVRSAGRAAAAANNNTFPINMITRLPVAGITLTTSAASGSSVSAYRVSGSSVTYATLDGDGGCVGVIDNIATRVVSFVRDRTVSPSNCTGLKVASVGVTSAYDQNNALDVDFDTAANVTTTTSTTSTTTTTSTPSAVVSANLTSFAVRTGSTMYDEARDIATYPDGTALVTGSFSGTVSFGSTVLTSAGGLDVFAGRLNQNGTWQWAVRVGSTGDDVGYGLAIDTSTQSAYVVGQFSSSASFGTTTLAGSATGAPFVALVNASGVWQWAVSPAGGTGGDFAQDVSVYPDGSAVLVGRVSGSSVFGSTTLTASNGDAFAAKIDKYGTWKWALIGTSSSTSDAAFAVQVLTDGTALVGGRANLGVFGSTTLSSTAQAYDGFLASISTTGSWVWAQKIASPSGSNDVLSISATSDGSALVSGTMYGTTLLGSIALISRGSGDAFVGKISSSGIWAYAASGGSAGLDRGWSVAALADGTAAVAVAASGATTFATVLVGANNSSSTDVVLLRLSSTGVWTSGTYAGGAVSDAAYGLATRSDGSVLFAGSFAQTAAAGATATFGPSTLTTSGLADIVIGSYTQAGIVG